MDVKFRGFGLPGPQHKFLAAINARFKICFHPFRIEYTYDLWTMAVPVNNVKTVNKYFWLGALPILLCGCDSPAKYKLQMTQPANAPLFGKPSVLVSMPTNSLFLGKECYGSGQAAMNGIAESARKYFRTVRIADQIQPFEAALSHASCDYLLWLNVDKWEDWNTAWNGTSDKIAIQISTFEVSSGKQIAVGTITAEGPFWTLKDWKPADLVAPAANLYFKAIASQH